MKFHVGCGTVYLKNYINLDLQGPNTFLAKDRPDLVARYITTADKYYARHEDKTKDILRYGPLRQDIVVDDFGGFSDLSSCAYGLVDEIIARQVLEHLSYKELDEAIISARCVLKPGGEFLLSIPDFEEALELYATTKDPFYKRHLFGPRDSFWGYHIAYSRGDMIEMFGKHGLYLVRDEVNIHNYPAVTLRFRKV